MIICVQYKVINMAFRSPKHKVMKTSMSSQHIYNRWKIFTIVVHQRWCWVPYSLSRHKVMTDVKFVECSKQARFQIFQNSTNLALWATKLRMEEVLPFYLEKNFNLFTQIQINVRCFVNTYNNFSLNSTNYTIKGNFSP